MHWICASNCLNSVSTGEWNIYERKKNKKKNKVHRKRRICIELEKSFHKTYSLFEKLEFWSSVFWIKYFYCIKQCVMSLGSISLMRMEQKSFYQHFELNLNRILYVFNFDKVDKSRLKQFHCLYFGIFWKWEKNRHLNRFLYVPYQRVSWFLIKLVPFNISDDEAIYLCHFIFINFDALDQHITIFADYFFFSDEKNLRPKRL